jgi:hypothetical protein
MSLHNAFFFLVSNLSLFNAGACDWVVGGKIVVLVSKDGHVQRWRCTL